MTTNCSTEEKETVRDYTCQNFYIGDNLLPPIVLPPPLLNVQYEKKVIYNIVIKDVPLIKFIIAGFGEMITTKNFSIRTKDTYFDEYKIDEYTIEWSTEYVKAFNSEAKCASVTISQTETMGIRYALWMRKKNGRCHWIYIDKLKEYNKEYSSMFDCLEMKLKKYVPEL